DQDDRDAGAELQPRAASTPAAALRWRDQRGALGRGGRERTARGRGHRTHREARRWMRAYTSITSDTRMIIPSASAFPTFSWPRTISLCIWQAIWSVTSAQPWLTSAAAVAYAEKELVN